MANDDGRPLPQPRGPPPGATAPPEHVDKPQVYEIFHGSKPEDRDGSLASAPTSPEAPNNKRPTIADGLKTIKSDDWLKVHQIPCARQGFLTGIGAGALIGAGRYLFGARVPKAANWAAGGFLLGSIIQWEFCQYSRTQERVAMARAVEIIDRKQAEKKAKAEEAARRRAEANEKAKEAAQKSWYKFW
ncbi:hypothetical protein JX265_000435 [Neoarthrinium moseri]|uniref:Cytochrome c oxidase assembly protein COX20, mitochondrial n=1 Tax=Neoarthrinium moseri TaxID=1658444 RepID=A0A9P9WYR8_9PEZI|nr:uncharacterized protein JN550_000685 [Neoarthrinium moseri]KAI1851331.1 hypothetical protein JX266_003406 [Neoarthrinium moseri]KAI1878503.1 hypothetical protein JN550_000685 [Neoarthrinium moseri]KAI1881609.1 hypothetical protein JX265_000435 [Neoarthrinium moseri]